MLTLANWTITHAGPTKALTEMSRGNGLTVMTVKDPLHLIHVCQTSNYARAVYVRHKSVSRV